MTTRAARTSRTESHQGLLHIYGLKMVTSKSCLHRAAAVFADCSRIRETVCRQARGDAQGSLLGDSSGFSIMQYEDWEDAKRGTMKYKQMLKIRKTEKDLQVRDRILLNVLVKRDGMSVTRAALHLGMAPSWGVKWHSRYLKECVAGLQTRTRSGRPPRISGETLKAVKKK